MFTGLISAIGLVESYEPKGDSGVLKVQVAYPNVVLGESIAINGACLTVTDYANECMTFECSPATLALTHFATLSAGDRVNCERALLASDRLGGHFVTGHVDQMVVVSNKVQHDRYFSMSFSGVLPENIMTVQPKGSVTVNGVSLTVNRVYHDGFEVMLIPETLTKTTLSELQIGSHCHLECDMLVKAVMRQLSLIQLEMAGEAA